MNHVIDFNQWLNENRLNEAEEQETCIISLTAKGADEIKKELKTNKVEYELIDPYKIKLVMTPKAKMAVQMTKERCGLNCLSMKKC